MRTSQEGRPVIGISAYCEQARWGVWDQRATLLPQSYVDQVVAAGGVPVLLPPVPGVEAAIGRLDGLIISGGPDVEPALYGHDAGPHTTVVRPERDSAEVALFRAMHAASRPVLGICRGMQLINVALGGTLIQHLPEAVGHDGHSPTPGVMAEHKVTVASSSKLASLVGDRLGETVLGVPTHHHQGIDRLGAGLVAAAWADDGLIEAIELDRSALDGSALDGSALDGRARPGHPFTLAVQWHPEAGEDPALFRALVAAAAQSAAFDSGT